MTAVIEPEVGRGRLRKEDARLITGRTNWTDNITLPGMTHLAILRSPYAHARITRIDASAAKSRPNVIGAFTGADIADTQGVLACAWPVTEDMVAPTYLPVAIDEVRHVGEPVAVVVARDRASAIDALDAIEVEYEPLPVVLDLEGALAEGSPLVHTDQGTNKCYTWVFDSAAAGTGLDVAEAISAAEAAGDIVLRRRYVHQRLIPAFMEPRSVVVDPGGGSELTVYSATQIPHIVRFLLAATTGIPEHTIRVVAPDVGGGFGGKLAVTPEEWLSVAVARKVGRPVKYTETRAESLVSGHHGRDVIQDITLTALRDGTVTGLDVKLTANMGAYLGIVTPGVPLLGAFMYNGIYKFPAYRLECTGVFTNTTKTDAYRGAGRPEATYAIERIMDELAVELGVDPIDVRRRNWIKSAEFPFTSVAGLVYDSGDYDAATDKALALLGYDDLRVEQSARRAIDDPIQLGIGVSTYTEMCGLAPSRVLGALRYGAGGWESVSIRVLPTGKVEVVSGSTPHGQGHLTAWSQIVADQLGVAFEDVTVLHGDTRVSVKGMDTYGSRSLAVGGIALVMACEKVRDKAKVIAAHMLECAPSDVEFTEGAFRVRGNPEAAKSLGECAIAVFAAHNLPDGVEPQLDSEATFDPSTFSFPHGTHLCAVEVDTETGAVKIRRYVAVDDVGRVINPIIVEGQVHGGVAQGIAQALFEEAVYDENGNLVTGSFAEYLLPSAADLPEIISDRTETPATTHPLGVKGVGEAGTIASTPAVVNAIVDALRHKGVNDISMPCTPERVWRAASPGGYGMIPVAFDYVRPSSVDEAVAALVSGGEDAKILAGGQSLLPVLRLRLAAPASVVDLGGITGLRGIRIEDDALVVGAMTTHADVATSPLVTAEAPLVAAAAAVIGDRQVRNRGTLGGSIAHADPAGDLPAVAVALDATIVVDGPSGRRSIAAGDFFTDIFTTALEPHDVLVEVRFPRLPGWTARYEKFHRTAQAWALVGVAAAVRRGPDGAIAEARVALTNMGPTPVRATRVEAALVGAADLGTVKSAAANAGEATSPPSDISGSAEYRRHLAGVLTARAVASAAAM